MKRAGKLIIVCGLPGSGKTTAAKILEDKLQAIRFCPDDWMDALSINLHCEEIRAKIEALQWKFAQDLLRLGLTVIIEWGTWARSERDALRLRARELGAGVELHYLHAPSLDLLRERLQFRAREDPPIKPDEISRWFEIFEPPTAEEMELFDKAVIDATSS